ncbi:MAG: UDP-3-O-(3-hydroxymyristoyl)glucosamine N-acyltransferase [Candidatus Margulisbacteria bacterium]|nr:UDP-3-O-(3-hydroxymyristoyl)glucosamine N-acyltransferase [Candidatus Margulisiibacteriota bacterium]
MKLSKIAKTIGGKIFGQDIEVKNIKSILTARAEDLTILLDKLYLKDAQKSKACAIVTFTTEVKPKNGILVKNPRKVLPKLLKLFAYEDKQLGISKTASIDDSVKLGKALFIDDYVRIKEKTVIQDNVKIYSGATIGRNVVIGAGTIIYPNVTIYNNTQIGKNCIIHAGAVLGADGFGFERNEKKEWEKVTQLGKVVIGNDVEIGANSCVDRGAIQDTVIGDGTKIDNLVQIGHNCIVGKHNVFSSMAGLAGSTIVGDYCIWGGQAATAGHLTVGNDVTIMGRSGVTKNIKDNEVIQGFPAQNYKKEWKEQAVLRKWARRQLNKEEKTDEE